MRKAVGYMRAVSPSGSEWGDTTHGRLYISSTATSSRAGSTSPCPRRGEQTGTHPPSSHPPNHQQENVDHAHVENPWHAHKSLHKQNRLCTVTAQTDHWARITYRYSLVHTVVRETCYTDIISQKLQVAMSHLYTSCREGQWALQALLWQLFIIMYQ